MEHEAHEGKPKYEPNRAERRFLDAMRRRVKRGSKLNPQQAASLEHFERLGVPL